MLAWFRAGARSISSAALASLVTLTVWSAAPHPDDCHDPVCGVVAPHDWSGHSIGRAQSTATHPLHCILCHWTRTVRPPAATGEPFIPAVEDHPRAHVDVFSALPQFAATQPPLRAPPLHL